VPYVLGQHDAQMPSAQDTHAIGELRSDRAHEPFGIAVRPWTTRRNLDRRDVRVGQVTDLLRGPRAVRIRCGAEDADVATADLQHEEHVDPLEKSHANIVDTAP
jgi:hypothetical protein